MPAPSPRKLRLNTERLTELTADELTLVAGAGVKQTDTCPPVWVTLLCNIKPPAPGN